MVMHSNAFWHLCHLLLAFHIILFWGESIGPPFPLVIQILRRLRLLRVTHCEVPSLTLDCRSQLVVTGALISPTVPGLELGSKTNIGFPSKVALDAKFFIFGYSKNLEN